MSTKISQKDAVVNEVKAILGASFDPSLPAKDQLTKDQIGFIKSNIITGIVGGLISYGADENNAQGVSTYVSGMISNHFRKAKELNGGEKYVTQSAESGSRDASITALNKLLRTLEEGSDSYVEVQQAIVTRTAELSSFKEEEFKQKKKQKELKAIDTDALPESLRELANSLVSNS